MAPHLNIVPSMFVLFLLFISASKVQSDAIDVVAKFGTKADGKTDLSKSFLDAWKEACASVTPSTVVIPKGTYLLSKVNLKVPCKAPIEINVQGTVQAPADPNAFKDPNWVRFYSIENFKMSGGGIFDGQGSIAYEKNKDPDNREFRSKLLAVLKASKVQSGAIDVVAKFGAKADGKTDLSKAS
ncbi:polygalacturonase-like [Gossypium hirsutum]|uniref:Polygalacturonase-like n=1 Tax=Gossypium hirsutum TaxID=3635 RepID=A0ABM3AMN1_GOSHI|nr:polygalacturonase-like [Gossypium hirsutum]